MKKYLLLILLFTQQTTFASEEGLYAWWMTIKFPVTDNQILSQSVTSINKNWLKASLLNEAMIKKLTNSEQYQEFKSSNMKFHLEMDLNKNGTNEQLYTGVYKAKDGTTGKFIVIFEANKLLKVLSRQDIPGYSALLHHKGELRWYQCMQCGEYETVKWSASGYSLY